MNFGKNKSLIRFPKRRIRKSIMAAKPKPSLTEVFSGCAVLISAAALIFSTQQYVETKRMERQKPFHEESFRTYVELSDTVAKLATLPHGSKEHTAAVHRYWQLVFGQVRMLADPDVQKITLKSSAWVRECFQEKGVSSKKQQCIDVSGNALAMQVSETAKNAFNKSVHVPIQ